MDKNNKKVEYLSRRSPYKVGRVDKAGNRMKL